jgi:hypothetical protein
MTHWISLILDDIGTCLAQEQNAIFSVIVTSTAIILILVLWTSLAFDDLMIWPPSWRFSDFRFSEGWLIGKANVKIWQASSDRYSQDYNYSCSWDYDHKHPPELCFSWTAFPKPDINWTFLNHPQRGGPRAASLRPRRASMSSPEISVCYPRVLDDGRSWGNDSMK